MNKALSAKKLIIAIIIASLCSIYLSTTYQRREETLSKGATTGAYTWLIKMLNLQQIAVGFLWMQFDKDSLNIMANYHRQLITLDAITALDPKDFDAWSLKCYMRLDQAIKKHHPEMKSRALKDFKLACRLNPNDWQFRQDAAESIFFKLKNIDLALKYALEAEKFPDHGMRTEKLLSHIYKIKKDYKKALYYQEKLLKRSDLTTGDKQQAKINIQILKNLIKKQQ